MSVEDKVAGLQGQLDSFKLFMFLVNPNTQHLSFQDYLDQGGTVPEKFREMLYGLAQTASMFGFDADINGDVTQMIDDLSPQMLVDILKGLNEETFIKTLTDNPALSGVIAGIAGPIIAEDVPKMSLTEASTLIGMNVDWGDMGELTIEAAQDPSALTEKVSGMDNNETLNFLKSLPPELQATVREKLVEGTEGLDISGMSLEDAIVARAKYGEENDYGGLFNWYSSVAPSSINAVYEEIRVALPGHISTELKTRLEGLNTGDGDNLPNIPHEKLYATLQAKIADGSLLKMLSEGDLMAKAKEGLKALEDHAFLVNLLPPDMMDEAMFNKIREGLAQFGLLGPVGGIVMQLASFVLNLIQTHAPGFIGQEKTDSMVAKLQSFVDPTITPQTPVLPPDPSATTTDPAAAHDPVP